MHRDFTYAQCCTLSPGSDLFTAWPNGRPQEYIKCVRFGFWRSSHGYRLSTSKNFTQTTTHSLTTSANRFTLSPASGKQPHSDINTCRSIPPP